MRSGFREDMLCQLTEMIVSGTTAHPVRVAIDGRPASGKTTLANDLRELLEARGRFVIRATIDEFMYPKAVRYRRGVDSPEGCYHDSFDFDALHRALLDPLGPGGSRTYRTATYDRAADRVVVLPSEMAPVEAVLLFDGVFLMRPELNNSWDLRVLVSTSFEESLRRARLRDVTSLGSVHRVEERFRSRYLPSQAYYAESVMPGELADVVVDNEDPHRPTWVMRSR